MRIYGTVGFCFVVASCDVEFGKYGLLLLCLYYLLRFASLRFASPCVACVV